MLRACVERALSTFSVSVSCPRFGLTLCQEVILCDVVSLRHSRFLSLPPSLFLGR